MSILEELHTLLSALGFPVETGHFTDTAPERYFVTVPLSDRFALHADNRPGANIEEARISLFSRGSYSAMKQRTVKALLEADFTVTDRRYLGFDSETGYHHYVIDAAKYYEWEV